MQRRPKRNSCKHLQGHSVHCSTFCICQSEPTSLGRTFLYFQANLQYSWKTRIATSRWASGLLWQDQELFWKYLSRGRPARRLWCPQVSRLMATPCSWLWSVTRQLTLESMWMDIGKPTSPRSAKTFCHILMSSYHRKARKILSFWMLKQGKRLFIIIYHNPIWSATGFARLSCKIGFVLRFWKWMMKSESFPNPILRLDKFYLKYKDKLLPLCCVNYVVLHI